MPPSLVDLPADALALVLERLDFEGVECALATCEALRAYARDDATYARLAHAWWGDSFWRRALTRRTWRVHVSMRQELRDIARFERWMRATGGTPWTREHYESLWRCEERAWVARRRREGAQRRPE